MQDIIYYADLQVDTTARQTLQAGKSVPLTETEYRMLVFLLRHQGVVCRRDDIINNVWGERFLYDTGTLDVHLSSLRRKLGWTKEGPVRSIRGVGFILPHEAPASKVVKIDTFLRELLMLHEDALREKGIHCYLRLTPFVYEIAVEEATLRQIFSDIFAFLLEHAPQEARWEIASQLTIREYTITITSTGSCSDFSQLTAARQQAAFLGIPVRMGSKPTRGGDIMGVELAIPMESMDS
ncbi:MAG: winged helix-turn-helix domain-containing protein [Bacteroidaceae bacterium]|nr:winged helix-turn-helix domain-containing protein [Bacteroidaceae bacterium]MBQ9294540.1 winged helix-turn-helix domain-containing protein [Bacteroidaceae bacterium]